MMKVKPFSEVKLKTALLRGKQAKKRFGAITLTTAKFSKKRKKHCFD